MLKVNLPEHAFEKLRCSLCKEYLSQLPVYIYPDNEGIGCGRCPILSEQNPIRNTAYEAVAEYLSFPCRYKPYGCLENALSINMPSHEESCAFKQYFCPFIPLASCPWQGPSSELFDHYQEYHKILALEDSTFEIDLINMYEDNFLLMDSGELFIIHTKCEYDENNKIFWCGVRYVGSKKMARNFLFQLELQKQGSIKMMKLSEKFVQWDDSMNLDKTTAVNINTDEIKKTLDDPCIIVCNVRILENKNLVDLTNSAIATTAIVSNDVDEDILRELECPICNEYMVPPIHQCVAGHSICGSCKPQVTECPTCRDTIQDTRNFSLEKMTRLIKYCCKYRDYDCNFVSSSEHIRQHETNCKFGPYNCPFLGYNNCKWKGKLCDIVNHAKVDHEDNVLEVEYLTWPYDETFPEENDDDCYVLKVYGEMFKLIFKYESSMLYWSMQYVGPLEDASKYMFELDIHDNSESNQRFFIKKSCNSLTNHLEAFNDENVFIQIPIVLIKPFLQGSDLVYRCRVVKKNK